MKKIKILLFILLESSLLSFKPLSTGELVVEWHALTKFKTIMDNGETSEEKEAAGHSYIVFKNNLNKGVYLGHFYLRAGEDVSVGLWSNASSGSSSSSGSGSSSGSSNNYYVDHAGVYYNLEKYYYTKYEVGINDTYVSRSISDDSKISRVSNVISDKNDIYNLMTYNCANFSTEIWNIVDDKSYWTGWFRDPSFVIKDIVGGYNDYKVESTRAHLSSTDYFYYFDGYLKQERFGR